jgi:glycosyltransferase 2 family protein
MHPSLRTTAHVAIALAVIAGIAYWVDLGAVGAALLSLPAAVLVAALALATCDRFLMAWKWRHLVVAGGGELSFLAALRIYYQAVAGGRLIPASLGGDVLRAWLAVLAGVPGGLAVSALLLEKLIAVFAFVLVALAGLLYLGPLTLAPTSQHSMQLLAAILLPTGLAIMAVVLFAPLHRAGLRLTAHLAARWPSFQRVHRSLDRVGRSLQDFRRRPGVLLRNGLLSLIELMLQLAKLALIASGLGIVIEASLFAIFAVALFVRRIAGLLENWGLGEGSAVLILVLFGIDPALAVALFIANFAISTIAMLPGAILYFTHPIMPPEREAHS